VCLLIFCTPGSNDVAKVAALVLDLRVVAHHVRRMVDGEYLDSKDRDVGCRSRTITTGSNIFGIMFQSSWSSATDRTPRYKTADAEAAGKRQCGQVPVRGCRPRPCQRDPASGDMHHGSSHELIPQRIRASESGRARRRLRWTLFEAVPFVATCGCNGGETVQGSFNKEVALCKELNSTFRLKPSRSNFAVLGSEWLRNHRPVC
jgi:hypothetical protein